MVGNKDENAIMDGALLLQNPATPDENFRDDMTNNFDPPSDLYELASNNDELAANGPSQQIPPPLGDIQSTIWYANIFKVGE